MKANRKFLHGDEEAVSPVIAVILMVAITVVLAATVYVWVSGFGSQSTSPANSLGLTSAGPITRGDGNDDSDTADATDYDFKQYVVASASPSLTYGDLTATIGGESYTLEDLATACDADGTETDHDALGDNQFKACAGTTERTGSNTVTAGDVITFRNDGASATLLDDDLIIVDSNSNSVMVTLKVR